MDYEAIAKRVDEALIEQVEDDGGVLHRHKIKTVVESVLRKMVPPPTPYAYGGLCVTIGLDAIKRQIDQLNKDQAALSSGAYVWGDSGVDPTEWR